MSGFETEWATAVGLALSGLLAIVAFIDVKAISDGRFVTVLCVLVAGSIVVLLFVDGTSAWRAVPMFLQACILAVLVAFTVLTALRRSTIDLQMILAAICCYVLAGLVYAWTYLAIDVLDDAQFSIPSTEPAEYFSFSFVVQTTLGFGNEVPTSPFASRIVVTQAILGQIFLATFVARLVSLYGRSNTRTDRTDQA